MLETDLAFAYFGTVPLNATNAIFWADLQPQLRVGLERLRDAQVALIEAICGSSPRANEVAAKFGVHAKLGWQIWNIAYSDDLKLAVRSIPSERSLRVWRQAAESVAAPSDLVTRVVEAHRSFDQLAEAHAPDRELLELMVEASAPPEEAAETRWRRQAFMGATYIWGVRAKTLLSSVFLHPSPQGKTFDMVRIQGLLGLLRARPNVRWPFSQSIVQSPDDAPRTPKREPLSGSASAERNGTPLLVEFCSQPTPQVQRRLSDLGMLEDELLPGVVGRAGECDVITGEIVREVAPIHATQPGELALFGAGVRTPAELLISDHFVHRDLFPGVERELCVFSELISPLTRDDRDRLSVSERVQSLGRGFERIRTAEIPRYAELAEFVTRRTGWRAEEFDVFRVRMRYPPIPVAVMLRHPLPAPV